ncbi:hypothetical protein Esti_004760 [Eimeria stiedai]
MHKSTKKMLAPWFLFSLAAFGDYVVEAAVNAAVSTDLNVEASPQDELDRQVPISLGPEARKRYFKMLPVLIMIAVTASLAIAYAVARYRALPKKGAGDAELGDKSEASLLQCVEGNFFALPIFCLRYMTSRHDSLMVKKSAQNGQGPEVNKQRRGSGLQLPLTAIATACSMVSFLPEFLDPCFSQLVAVRDVFASCRACVRVVQLRESDLQGKGLSWGGYCARSAL